jgi:hypothetical protein
MTTFKERVYELAFGDDAINKDYSDDEVLAVLREFSDKALAFDQMEAITQDLSEILAKGGRYEY